MNQRGVVPIGIIGIIAVLMFGWLVQMKEMNNEPDFEFYVKGGQIAKR